MHALLGPVGFLLGPLGLGAEDGHEDDQGQDQWNLLHFVRGNYSRPILMTSVSSAFLADLSL